MHLIKKEWLIRSKLNVYKKRINHAQDIIKQAVKSENQFGISWSGGKDSTVMTHLIKKIYPDIPVIVQIDDCDWPEKLPYLKMISSKYKWNPYYTTPKFSIWEAIKKINLYEQNICNKQHYLTKYGFLEPLNKQYKALRLNGKFIGLRKDESKRRLFNYLRKGMLYRNKNDELICCPISRLETIDIFAYLVEQDIPINPCYFKNKFKQPEEIRLSWALPITITDGGMEHIKYYYPDLFYKLREVINY